MERKKDEDDKQFEYSFGGPNGVLAIILSLPLFVLFVVVSLKPDVEFLNVGNILSFFTAAKWIVAWFGFIAALYFVPIGKKVPGFPLKTGKRLSYRCNALFTYISTLSIVAIAYFGFDYPLHQFYENIIQLATAAIFFAAILSFYLFKRADGIPASDRAEHGTSGNAVYDFFMGKELNPRTGAFDWKFFCELRPGLIGWVVLELSMLAWQYETTKQVSFPLILLVLYHMWYVGDALWWESAVLSTKDIIEEGFGFMLAFGDLAWLPFFYSSQAQYLATAQTEVSTILVLLSIYFHAHGYWIFRRSNLQKNIFRQNPKDIRLIGFRSIPTANPDKPLLCSGWWLFVRHPNYLGDLMMTVSWTFLCGFGSLHPFMYCVYMFALLVHRELRDEAVCRAKYGTAWDQYCAKVPYRIFPFVF